MMAEQWIMVGSWSLGHDFYAIGEKKSMRNPLFDQTKNIPGYRGQVEATV